MCALFLNSETKDLRHAYEERVEMSEQAIEDCKAKMKLDTEKTVRKIRAEVSPICSACCGSLPPFAIPPDIIYV